MSKYSFLLQSEEPEYFELLPTLRLKKHGGWLVAESIEQEEISRNQSQATVRAVQLAKRIAKDKDISLEEAFNALQGAGGLSEMDLLSDYTEDALSMLTGGNSAEAGNAKLVTTFIRTRGEGLIEGEWKAIEDWSLEDTKGMGRQLVAKVLEFVMEEQQVESGEAEQKKGRSRKKIPALEG